MKKIYSLFSIFITGVIISVSGTGLTIHAGDDFYFRIDRLDSTQNTFTRTYNYGSFGLALDNIGGSGLSFYSDLLATNAFLDKANGGSSRKIVEFSNGYFDWRHKEGLFGFRLGRQLYTNLTLDSYDMDGLRIAINPNSQVAINVAGGILVPTPYGKMEISRVPSQNFAIDSSDEISYKHNAFSNPAKAAVASIDGSLSMIPFTNLILSFSLVPSRYMRPVFDYDSVQNIDPATSTPIPGSFSRLLVEQPSNDKHDFRASLGVDLSPFDFIRLNGSGRFSLIEKGFDRFDWRLTVLPINMIEISAYMLSEKGRVDSTNYFSRMFYGQSNEFGLSLNAYPLDAGVCIQADYHAMTFKDEGTDHFMSFDVGHYAFSGGATISLGYHGEAIRPHAALSLPLGKIFSLEGAGEFYRVWPAKYKKVYEDVMVIGYNPITLQLDDTSYVPTTLDKKYKSNPYNAIYFTGGIKMSIPLIGLTLYPRLEYIINRYYKNDIRFLLTSKLLFKGFWGGKE